MLNAKTLIAGPERDIIKYSLIKMILYLLLYISLLFLKISPQIIIADHFKQWQSTKYNKTKSEGTLVDYMNVKGRVENRSLWFLKQPQCETKVKRILPDTICGMMALYTFSTLMPYIWSYALR